MLAEVGLDLAGDAEAEDGRGGAEHARDRVPVQEERDHVGARERDAEGGKGGRGAGGAPRKQCNGLQAQSPSSSQRAPFRSSSPSCRSTKIASSPTSARSPSREVPERLLVIGGGVIGVELGSVWRRLGAKVTIVELLPSILAGYDAELAREAEKAYRKQGLEIRTGDARSPARDATAIACSSTSRRMERRETLEADRVLVSVGRKPSLSGIDAQALGLALGARGEIVVDDQMRTNLPDVYAIGDAVGGMLLAHKAEDEGMIAAEVIAGQNSHMHYGAIPAVVYTTPEVVSVGLSEEQVKESGREYKVGQVPVLRERARAHGRRERGIRQAHRGRADRCAARCAPPRTDGVGAGCGAHAHAGIRRLERGHRAHGASASDVERGDARGGARACWAARFTF